MKLKESIGDEIYLNAIYNIFYHNYFRLTNTKLCNSLPANSYYQGIIKREVQT